MIIKCFSKLAFIVAISAVLPLKACSKDPILAVESIGIITMATNSSQVDISIKLKEDSDNFGNLTIDWGDGEKSKITDATSYGKSGTLEFSRNYSNTSRKHITISGDNIELLYCNNNQLTALDVSRNTTLTYLDCSNNQLTVLDVSLNKELKELRCSKNQLTSLDVSRNTKLTGLYCSNNQLSDLDVSLLNTTLIYLYCYNNQLSALDVSQNTALTDIDVCNNQIKNLDFSKNTALHLLCCKQNPLTASALNDMFGTLCYIPETIWSAIDIGLLPSESDCDFSIALKKGWVFGPIHGSRSL